jgi:hypothetical protein
MDFLEDFGYQELWDKMYCPTGFCLALDPVPDQVILDKCIFSMQPDGALQVEGGWKSSMQDTLFEMPYQGVELLGLL